MKPVVPSEYVEHTAFVRWLRTEGILHWHTPNQTYTTSDKQKSINRALGVQSGIPDLFVIIDGRVYGIEMKRIRGGVVSANQKTWIARLNAANVPTFVCNGSQEAKDCVNKIRGVTPDESPF